jgi:hypothetical protein
MLGLLTLGLLTAVRPGAGQPRYRSSTERAAPVAWRERLATDATVGEARGRCNLASASRSIRHFRAPRWSARESSCRRRRQRALRRYCHCLHHCPAGAGLDRHARLVVLIFPRARGARMLRSTEPVEWRGGWISPAAWEGRHIGDTVVAAASGDDLTEAPGSLRDPQAFASRSHFAFAVLGGSSRHERPPERRATSCDAGDCGRERGHPVCGPRAVIAMIRQPAPRERAWVGGVAPQSVSRHCTRRAIPRSLIFPRVTHRGSALGWHGQGWVESVFGAE